jgi:hypothetical protein
MPPAWFTNVIDSGTGDHSSSVAAMCWTGALTIDIEELAVNSQNQAAQPVLCHQGETATGGGAAASLGGYLRNSAPVFDDGTANGQRLTNTPDGTRGAPIGWRSTVYNDTNGDYTTRTAAVCAAGIDDVITVVASTTLAAGDKTSERAFCPDNRRAIGGGVDVADAADVRLLASGPLFDDGTANGQRLLDRPSGTNPSAIGWYVAAHSNDAADRTLKVAVLCPEAVEVEAECAAFAALLALRRRRDGARPLQHPPGQAGAAPARSGASATGAALARWRSSASRWCSIR